MQQKNITSTEKNDHVGFRRLLFCIYYLYYLVNQRDICAEMHVAPQETRINYFHEIIGLRCTDP